MYSAGFSILQEREDSVGDELPNEFPIEHSMEVKQQLIKLLCQHISVLDIGRERALPQYLDENLPSASSPKPSWARDPGTEPKGWTGFC